MTRNQLAEEMNVAPWDVDDWLLLGCPVEKILSQWVFKIEAVREWLKENKIKIKPTFPSNSKPPQFDSGWIDKRCPICREKGFPGEAAGLLYTLGEIVMGEWRFRRVGYPCGHSVEIISWP